ncbi:MAG: hypothetical protein FRX48_05521 [Lasallia pustulata]|uniref:Uncharacterized protein n=1 Tax=Lasallia pustulata TaxID=136370 RepID=A0A5M8PNN7_9LECA|nr:MAG: hypothetical protein FRX48_05521 [Lasallia pustulata]
MLRFIAISLPRQSPPVGKSLQGLDLVHRSLRTSLLRRVSCRFASELQRPTKSGYPERLLIYHAGTGKTVFIGCLKLTTIFLFSFSCLILAPSFYYAPDKPNWAAALAIAGGAVPMVFVAYTTAPFVCYVHLRLPIFARQSREQLFKWARKIPSSTEIDLTTVQSFGRPRVSRMKISDLRTTNARLGVANLAKRPQSSGTEIKRPWWRSKPQGLFYVGNDRARSREPSVWRKVLETIKGS